MCAVRVCDVCRAATSRAVAASDSLLYWIGGASAAPRSNGASSRCERVHWTAPGTSRAWYGVVDVASILHRAPICAPFFNSQRGLNQWRKAAEDLDANVRATKGYSLYNPYMGYH